MDPSDFFAMFQQVIDNYQRTDSMSSTSYADNVYKQIQGMVKNMSDITDKELKQFSKKMLELDRTLFGNSKDLTDARKIFIDTLLEFSKETKISAELLANLETAFKSAEIQLSQLYEKMKEETGEGIGRHSYNLQGARYRGSIEAQSQKEELGKDDQKLDSFRDKLFGFFLDLHQKSKVDMKHFGEDLVEGLAKSKFVGGAFMDLIKMFALFTGGFLKQFGPIGKALAVGVVALAPVLGGILVKLFADMLGKLLMDVVVKGSVQLLGNLLKGLLNPGNLAKAFGFLKGAGGILGTAGRAAVTGFKDPRLYIGGALTAMGVDSLKKEGGREKTAGGLLVGSGIGMMAMSFIGPIAAAFGVTLSPIIGPILAIAAGIGVILKFWPNIVDWFKGFSEKFDIITSAKNLLGNFWDWFKSLKWPWSSRKYDENGNEIGVPPGSRSKSLGQDTVENISAKQVGKLRVADDGSVTNLSSLSQTEAASELESLRASNKKSFDNVYEIAGEGVAHMASFQNDIVMKDEKGKKGAVLYKGATEDLMDLRKQLVAAGMSEERANLLMYTSGMSSSTSMHKKGGWKSHSNRYGLATDIAGIGWSLEESKMAYPILLKALQAKGYDAKAEDSTGFTTVDKMKGDNLHIDIKPLKNVTSAGAMENLKAQKKEVTEWSEWKKGFVESTEANLKMRLKEKEDIEKEADADGKRDDEEKRKIAEATKRYQDAYADAQEVKNYIPKRDVTDYTGNFLAGHKLRDTINMTWLQQHQQ